MFGLIWTIGMVTVGLIVGYGILLLIVGAIMWFVASVVAFGKWLDKTNENTKDKN